MKTSYELYFKKAPQISYFKVFGSKCFILNTKDYLTKFDPKSSEGVFLGYSNTRKSYQVFNLKTLMVEESLNVVFDESKPSSKFKDLVEDENDSNNDSQNSAEKVIR